MKIIYEFDIDQDKKAVLHAHECAMSILLAIDAITEQTREWHKYDPRWEIPKNEVISTISAIIKDKIDINKLYDVGDINESEV